MHYHPAGTTEYDHITTIQLHGLVFGIIVVHFVTEFAGKSDGETDDGFALIGGDQIGIFAVFVPFEGGFVVVEVDEKGAGVHGWHGGIGIECNLEVLEAYLSKTIWKLADVLDHSASVAHVQP